MKLESDISIDFHFKNMEGEFSRIGTLNAQDQTPQKTGPRPQVSKVFDARSIRIDAEGVDPKISDT